MSVNTREGGGVRSNADQSNADQDVPLDHADQVTTTVHSRLAPCRRARHAPYSPSSIQYHIAQCRVTSNIRSLAIQITACAVATSSCISHVPSQWEGQNFDPPLLPHFSTDLNGTQNQERYRGYDPTWKFLADVGRREGGLRREGIFRYFLCL